MMSTAAHQRLFLLVAVLGVASTERTELRWDDGWRFLRGTCAGASPSADDPCAAPSYDDSEWRELSLPHDWSREDLPSRATDADFPVLDLRYGAWKLNAGDNDSWAEPAFDDSQWDAGAGGADWRSYSRAFGAINATGWYRQHVAASAVTPSLLAGNLTLNLA